MAGADGGVISHGHDVHCPNRSRGYHRISCRTRSICPRNRSGLAGGCPPVTLGRSSPAFMTVSSSNSQETSKVVFAKRIAGGSTYQSNFLRKLFLYVTWFFARFSLFPNQEQSSVFFPSSLPDLCDTDQSPFNY